MFLVEVQEVGGSSTVSRILCRANNAWYIIGEVINDNLVVEGMGSSEHFHLSFNIRLGQ